VPSNNRVVVTGVGVIAPNGTGKDAFWDSLVHARSGIGPITLFDASRHPCRVAGEVKGFNLLEYLRPKVRLGRLSRQTQLALAATKLALVDAGLDVSAQNGLRPMRVIMGVSTSAIDIVEQGMQRLVSNGPERVPSYVVASGQPQHTVSLIVEQFELDASGQTIASACAAGLESVAAAAEAVREGRTEVAIAGGTDAPVTPLTFACLEKTGLVAAYREAPERASRPFDRDRETGVVSEGAAVLIVESLGHALARGAPIYFEITGYGTQNDPVGSPPGTGLRRAMELALANACRQPAEIDYICAHGPGHPVLDRVETEMIKSVFGAEAYRIPVSSIKGVTGNALAAGGPLQLVACACALRDQLIPPTANLENPDPYCDLDFVAERPRLVRIGTVLVNCHGLGGGNASMVIERPDCA